MVIEGVELFDLDGPSLLSFLSHETRVNKNPFLEQI